MHNKHIRIFSLQQVVNAIEYVDKTIEVLFLEGRRDDILNERYYHHMFSAYLANLISVEETWKNLAIYPEHPTEMKLSHENIHLDDVEYTRKFAKDHGKHGNLDFRIPSNPSISIEWKGPENCDEQDLAEVFLKLLGEKASTLKIFVAIFLTKKGNRDHVPKLKVKIRNSLRFACKVHKIEDLSKMNLYAFIRCRYDIGSKEISWGAITSIDSSFI